MSTLMQQPTSAWLKRWAGYFSWSIADQIILLGVPKLVLFPILALTLGEGSFGSLVLALGLMQLVGLAPSNGLVGYVIRDLVHEGPREQELLLRSTLILAGLVSLPFACVFWVGAPAIAGMYGNDPHLKALLPYLGGYLIFTNFVETALASYRVQRRFDLISLMHGVQTAILFLAIPLYFAAGMKGVGAAHLLAPAVALVVIAVVERRLLLARPMFAPRFARAAMHVWPAFSLSALIALSAGYLDRILLGYWWSPAHVEPFFAAVATASIITVPGMICANLIFSILGRVRGSAGFDRGFYRLYGVAVVVSSVAAFAVGAAIGEGLLRFFYPRLAEAAALLWIPTLAGFCLLNVSILLRPFISKFLTPAAMPLLSLASLLARAFPLLLLVPKGGARGASLALLWGGLVTALLWLAMYTRSFLFGTQPIVEPAPDSDISTTAVNE